MIAGGRGTDIGFRPLREEDLPLLHAWLQLEHVSRWWGPPPTFEAVAREYLPSIHSEEPSHGYLMLLDGRPAGYIQTYLLTDWAAEWPEVEELAAAGMDLFIGDPHLLGQGLGPAVIRAFLSTIVFARPEVRSCWADPDARNTRSVRAFEKAGFRVMRDVWAEDAQTTERLVRIDREAVLDGRLDRDG